jgi:V8-like Glu-specific endopeptidase
MARRSTYGRRRRVSSVVAAVALAGQLSATVSPAAAGSIPTATPVPAGIPAVGAVFARGTRAPHGCTGAVLRSTRGNLVLTAAHCLAGSGTGVQFVPGYHNGVAPFGVWNVAAVYVDPRWATAQDPRFDYAIMALNPAGGRRATRLNALVGGYSLGAAPQSRHVVEAPAYAEGIKDIPFTCTAPVYYSGGFPAFNCHGYVSGTSGTPWLTRERNGTRVIRGVIGGPHQGGCFEYTSYSSRFTAAVPELLLRATRGGTTDHLPRPGGDGCGVQSSSSKTSAAALSRWARPGR